MKSSGIGGQAVLEGVMMKNQDEYAVAVRLQNKEIIVQKNKYVSITKKFPVLGIPIVRGVVNFIESLVIGTKTLTYSSSFFEEEEEKDKKIKTEESKDDEKKSSGDGLITALTVCASIILAVGIFMLIPFFVGDLLSNVIESSAARAIVEGLIRIVIFVAYIAAISQMKDIKRVFMYHGAEHKTINCVEHGLDLTVENVREQSKEHKRCGTSFMLIVMVISVIFFIFIRVDTIWLRMLYRILLVPVIAGVSYEFIRLAGRSDNKVVTILSKPGLWLQGLTTREPDDEMIEVAIKSVEAVFDWHKYLKDCETEFATIRKATRTEGKDVKSNKANVANKVSTTNKVNKSNKVNKTNEGNRNNDVNKINVVNLDKFDKKIVTENDVELNDKNKVSDSNVEEAKKEYASASIENAVRVKIVDDDDDEDDEILRALDRYFDTPNAKVLEQESQEPKED